MSFSPIPFSQSVNPGDKLQFSFCFYDIHRPSESDIINALQGIDIDISTVSYNLIPGLSGDCGTITGTVNNSTTPDSIASDIISALQKFSTVVNVSITEVDIDHFTLAPSIPTTVSLAAIAIIAIVILVVFLKLD
jgi:hypothetical protein